VTPQENAKAFSYFRKVVKSAFSSKLMRQAFSCPPPLK
jgi:hypothetical protein